MTSHNKKIMLLAGGKTILECSCGNFTKTATRGSRQHREEQLDYEHQKHIEETK